VTIVRDVVLTLITEGFVLISFFIFYHLLAEYYGSEGVGLYSLMRRIIALIIPIVMMGLSEGLGRYIAMSKSSEERFTFILSGAIVVLSLTSMMFVLLNADAMFSAKWLFGDIAYNNMVFPFSVLLFGLSLHSLSYACLRGNLQIKSLNILQSVNLGLLPLIILLLGKATSLDKILVIIGIIHCLVAVLFLARSLYQCRKDNFQGQFLLTLKNLLMFSVPRVPATIAGAGLISLCPIVASQYCSITEVGYLSLALGLLIGIGSAVTPLGTILLPHVSELLGGGEKERFEEKLYLLIGAVFQSLLFVSSQFIIFIDYILTIWIGEEFLPASPVMVVVLSALISYGFYIVARNILDAASVRPINSINSVIALGLLMSLMVLISFLGSSDNIVFLFALAITLSFNLLGILTYFSVRKLFDCNMREDWRHLEWGLILNIAIYVLVLLVKPDVTSHWLVWIIFEAILLWFYLFALWLLKFEWINIVYQRILKCNSPRMKFVLK
jgi:O-antigen/teichoic acid export membrane protein